MASLTKMIYLSIPIIMFFVLSGLALVSFKAASLHRNDVGPGRRGCFLTLANFLLRPVPVIFAFYQVGFVAAVIVALTMWLIVRCCDLYKGKFWSHGNLRLVVLPLGAFLTLSTGNFTYFQLVPSAWCVLLALEQLDGLIRGKAHLFPGDSDEPVFLGGELILARWGILAASLIALFVSEYCRHKLSLSGWIWYYGYLRLELLPIYLGAITPAMVKMIRRSEREPD